MVEVASRPYAEEVSHFRRRAGVVQARLKLQLHLHGAALAAHYPHHFMVAVGDLFRYRHEIGKADRAADGLEVGCQDVALRQVSVAVVEVASRPYAEVAAVGIANKGGENAGRIESREAKPINGTVAADECGGVHIPDYAVISDSPVRHPIPPDKC